MKPWRPYWKGLEQAIEVLTRNAEPAPFADKRHIPSWIQDRRFAELAAGNQEGIRLANHLADGTLSKPYYPLFSGTDFTWQLILRCACAVDFCSGRVENRTIFDWSRQPAHVYRDLLIDFWWSSALHWSSKIFAPDVTAARWERWRLAHRLSGTFLRVDPAVN